MDKAGAKHKSGSVPKYLKVIYIYVTGGMDPSGEMD